MGHMSYHTIIVTGSYPYDRKLDNGDVLPEYNGMHWAEIARRKALEIFSKEQVSELAYTEWENIRSFFVAPDGSKEGWEASDTGDENRDVFIKWLRGCEFDDNSSPLRWAEVQYGDDSGVTKIVRNSS